MATTSTDGIGTTILELIITEETGMEITTISIII
jgi:hypothetical protein